MRAFLFTVMSFAVVLGGTSANCLGQTSYPMITHVIPVAVQRGKTTEVSVEGQMDFSGVYKALFEGTGLSATVVTPPPPAKDARKSQPRSVKLQIQVDPDAAPGVREFRVASSLGVSSTGQLLVVDDPVVQSTTSRSMPIPSSPSLTTRDGKSLPTTTSISPTRS
jgi:hypothetical protein